MSGTKRGERSTGDYRPTQRSAAEREEDDFKTLLAERPAPADGRGTPMNIIRRPLELPPVERVKDG